MRNPPPHPGPLHAAGQKGGSVGQSRPSASRRLSSASRALCASHVSRTPRVTYIRRPAGVPHIGAPSSAGESGGGSGGVTRECAGGAAVGGSGAGFGGVTGESSAEAAAHPECRRRRVCAPREEVPLKSPADGLDPFGMRHTGRARGQPGVRGGGIGCRLLALDAEPVGAFDAVEREREAAEVLGRHRLLALAKLGHRAERQRSQGLDRDERAAPLGAGLACAAHSSAKRTVSRCRQIRPSMRSAQRPSSGRHARSVVRAGSKANDRRRAHEPAPRSRPWWRRPRWLRQRRPGLRPAAARPMSARPSRPRCPAGCRTASWCDAAAHATPRAPDYGAGRSREPERSRARHRVARA